MKNIWSYVLMLLLVYTAVITPVRITFIDVTDINWIFIDTIIDCLFFIDILVSFNSAYYDNSGVLITDRKAIIL